MSKIRIVLVNLLLIIIPTCLGIYLLDYSLKHSETLQQLDSPSPFYIPATAIELDRKVSRSGHRDENGFRTFRDTGNLYEELEKSTADCKIVIFGDSFVEGSGVKIKHTWPALLDQKVQCEVFAFGKNGSTTLEEFSFYRPFMQQAGVRLILFDLVENDPHPRINRGILRSKPEMNRYRKFYLDYIREEITPFEWMKKIELEEAERYLTGAFQRLIYPFMSSVGNADRLPIRSWGYANWLKRLYEDDIMLNWQRAVEQFISETEIPVAFVFTPVDATEDNLIHDAAFRDRLEGTGAAYFSCIEDMRQLYGTELRPRSAWSNPANPHPGRSATEAYADCIRRNLSERYSIR